MDLSVLNANSINSNQRRPVGNINQPKFGISGIYPDSVSSKVSTLSSTASTDSLSSDSMKTSSDSGLLSRSGSDRSFPRSPTVVSLTLAKPKRNLSAYNYFFKYQREKILKVTPMRAEGKPRRSHGKIGFADLARLIASKWKAVSPDKRAFYEELAVKDKARYVKEMNEWKEQCQRAIALSQQEAITPAQSHENCLWGNRPDLILSTGNASSMGEELFAYISKPLPYEPAPMMDVHTPLISDLAHHLDPESLDLLVNLFRP
jgi:hypothetical protein